MRHSNPVSKRHIGPAIQWAKPKNDKTRVASPRTREIKIELPDAAEESDHTDHVETQRDTLGGMQDEETSPRAGDEISHRGSHSTELAYETNDTWWQRTSRSSSDTQSAWSEYTTSHKGRAEERFSAYEPQTENTIVTYDYGAADTQTPVADTDQPGISQHNPRPFEGTAPASPQNDRTGWVQYLFPVAVVGFIIFLAFLTLGA